MSDPYDKLTKHQLDVGDIRTAYDQDEVLAAYKEIIWLDEHKNNFLAVHDDGGAISYAFFGFFMGPSSGPGAPKPGEPNPTYYTCEWHGCGFSGSLREMRHTWFAPDNEADQAGYVFYLNIDATVKALTHLKRYFDS